VDIDNLPASGSRFGDYGAHTFDNSGIIFNGNSSEDGPYIVFDPQDLLPEYFAANPVGRDNTDYWYRKNQKGTIDFHEGFNEQVFWGETAIGDGDTQKGHNHNMSYYIFPVWWREREGAKDYELYLCQSREDPRKPSETGAYTVNNWRAFFDRNYQPVGHDEVQLSDASHPFPTLGYSSTKRTKADVSVFDPKPLFSFDDGSYKQAYDPAGSGTVLSYGIKITFTDQRYSFQGTSAGTQDFDKHAFGKNAIGFYLTSNSGANESFSVPHMARYLWDGKYYDEQLENLFFANVSTKRTMVPDKTFLVRENHYKTGLLELEDGNEFHEINRSGSFLLGFNSAPSEAGDRSVRDYADVLLLVIPVNDDETDFCYVHEEEAEPFVWTMAAEDLGSTDDWDFNDAVFQFTDVIVNLNSTNKNAVATNVDGPLDAASVREITVTPMAAGGTMPIYALFYMDAMQLPSVGGASEDEWYHSLNGTIAQASTSQSPFAGPFIIGQELHKWLGATSYKQMINTGAKRSSAKVKPATFNIAVETNMGNSYKNPAASYFPNNGFGLYGFAVVVDRENTLSLDAGKDFQKVDLTRGQGIFVLGAPNAAEGQVAPQLFLVSGDWEWPTERTIITDAYPQFSDWVSWGGYMTKTWTNYPNRDKVTNK
ncbi:MAG: LruC domain-containing protein, partial [Muribaculaceae bacterium]|nr:LruC domain-containing protein [Muribaculaceae bacterium]